MRHDLRQEMEADTGHVNTAFTPSSSSLALRTRRLLEAAKVPSRDTDTAAEEKQLGGGGEAEAGAGLDGDSFLSELEHSGRGSRGAGQLHGYCDRSFERNILTFTNGDTGPLSREADTDTEVTVDGRPGEVVFRDQCSAVSAVSPGPAPAAPSLATQRLRGGARFTPRPAPPPIPEEPAEDSLHPASAPGSREAKRRPDARLGNLCGLIDTHKLRSLVGGAEARLDSSRPAPSAPPGSVLSSSDLASLVGVAGLVLLVAGHASPSWLVSWHDTHSPFVRMGPWQVQPASPAAVFMF